jgi:uncharacterized protein (TIGR03083 family)
VNGRKDDYEAIGAALLAQYAALVEGFAERDPSGPTDCEGWTVEDLETHVAITARGLARIAGKGGEGAPTGILEWAEQLPGLADQMDAATKGERLSLGDQVPLVRQALTSPGDSLVQQLTGTHTLRDATAFRLVEAVVHGLDADIAPHTAALKHVVKGLAATLAGTYPGKTVEVRIPPYAAVQCLEGPRHTRGTPPNVVETDGVSFVRLAAGRERWADLVADGRVRASGERSDLSAVLPLLG